MFKPNSVVVLGAGAGVDFGLPLGSQLSTTITDACEPRNLDGELATIRSGILNAVAFYDNGRVLHEQWSAVSRMIFDGMLEADSIDSYIHTIQNEFVETFGKLAIASSLLNAEANSRYFDLEASPSQVVASEELRDTWYQSFLKIATQGVTVGELDELFTDVKVISFNYDRSLELFLIRKLQRRYNLNETEAASRVAQLNIVRPYGSLGALRTGFSNDPLVRFGDHMNYGMIAQVAQRLRTFSELPNSETQNEVDEIINAANQLIFLGYGFHPQNNDVLSSSGSATRPKVYGTVFGFSDPNIAEIQSDIASRFNISNDQATSRIFLEKKGCAEFLRDYERVLSSQN